LHSLVFIPDADTSKEVAGDDMQAGSAILDTHAGMVADTAYEITALHNDIDFFGNNQFNASHEGMDVYPN